MKTMAPIKPMTLPQRRGSTATGGSPTLGPCRGLGVEESDSVAVADGVMTADYPYSI